MTIADVLTREQNGIFHCGGARVRAHRRQLATVVSIRGEIDAFNAEQLGEHIRRFILGEDRVVLDMGDVSQFAEAGISLLETFDEDCRAAGVQWTLVASAAVTESLGVGGTELSGACSVHEALHEVADSIARRRRLALSLLRTS
ncbi:STAS domain-containing protein [Mycobacterium seoulense]|uniref:STAS domain-containing protein n=1 Tax=Mycobacterium seoulense TaxID=386911 RepID=UPI003CF0A5D0